MSEIEDFQVQSVSFHRNGTSLPGFYAVRFSAVVDEVHEDLIATVPSFEGMWQHDLDVRVIDPTDLGRKWRGDRFVELLARTVERWPHQLVHGHFTEQFHPQAELLEIEASLR